MPTNEKNYLKKIKLGDDYYWLKDADLTERVSALESLPTINYEIVSVLPEAGADYEFNTCKTVYMINEGTGKTGDVYGEYICVKTGEEGSYVYSWEKIGDTRIDLSNYYNKTEVDGRLNAKEDKSNLKEFAYLNKSDVVANVPGQTISGVKATGTVSGSASVELTTVTATVSSSGSVTAEGSINVTLGDNTVSEITSVGTLPTYTEGSFSGGKATVVDTTKFNGGSAASFTEGAFTANVPTAIDVSKFNGGSIASYEHTGFEGGSLGEATKSQFAVEGLVASVGTGDDAECLVFTAASQGDAVTEQGAFTAAVYGTDTFNGGSAASLEDGFYTAGTAASKAADSFTANTVASLADGFVTAGSDAVYTAPTYVAGTLPSMADKTVTVASQSFTGSAVNVSVSGNYDKATGASGSVAIENVSLDVGDITVAAKDATISER